MTLLEGGKGLEKYDGIVSWSPGGESFFINKLDLFEKLVLPEFFFCNGKFSSFLRRVGLV